jgi:hypothetical protein
MMDAKLNGLKFLRGKLEKRDNQQHHFSVAFKGQNHMRQKVACDGFDVSGLNGIKSFIL